MILHLIPLTEILTASPFSHSIVVAILQLFAGLIGSQKGAAIHCTSVIYICMFF